MFLDVAEIEISAGKGGPGCVSTRKEKYVPRGGPDGGNGGRGGSVWFVATDQMTTLQDFRYKRSYQAGNGSPGGGKKMSGADGQDVVVLVPCGTLVYDLETDLLLGDLTEDGQRVLVAAGGKGGKGNWEFRNSRNQTPMFAQPGRPGERKSVRLELKLIADIGLVGEPNAGKSTLLSVISAARPKIAEYPFTTLVPNLGIVDLGDYRSCTVADIPGLIEGAAVGRGLGHEFLRHVERTRALLLLVDVTYESPGRALQVLRRELVEYGRHLGRLPFAVVLTKADLVPADRMEEARAEAAAWAEENGALAVQVISSATQAGLDGLRKLLLRLYGS